MSDTWLVTADAVSRIHTDCVHAFFPKAHKLEQRKWYLIFLLLLTAITSVTVLIEEPGTLILISAVIGFIGTVIYSVALIFLNHVYLRSRLPAAAHPGRTNLVFLIIVCGVYFVLAVLYFLTIVKVV